MRRVTHLKLDRQHGPSAWAAALRHEIQQAIGQQLRAQFQAPQELPADMAALVRRMEKEHATTA